jgi:hypothetical protein
MPNVTPTAPAYPVENQNQNGMTKMELIATEALKGLPLQPDYAYSKIDFDKGIPQQHADGCAKAAVRYAKALIKVLGESA